MQPKSLVIANWKMNLPKGGVESYVETVRAGVSGGSEAAIVLAPPFPYLTTVARGLAGSSLSLAAQDCSPETSGAWTGDTSAAMLQDCGCSLVIVGHSERRKHHHEDDALVRRKLDAAHAAGLLAVLCIGEDLETRESGGTEALLKRQIEGALAEGSPRPLVVAYEPVWAIGTGRNASAGMCAESRETITRILSAVWPSSGGSIPVLYGGSVTAANAGEIAADGAIDGFLVGGASLDAAAFLRICEAGSRLPAR